MTVQEKTAQEKSPTIDRVPEHPRQDMNDAIRASFLSDDDLRVAAAGMAKSETLNLPGYVPFDFIARQRENEREILAAYRSTVAAAEADELITPAAEWLADNHYVVEKNIREVERDLPLRFYRQLPTVGIDGAGTMPRAMALTWLYVAHTHSSVSLERLSAFVEGYQSARTLQIGELWAIPSIMRFVLIENLRRITDRVERARRMRAAANAAADRLSKVGGDESCQSLLDDIASYSHDNAFAAQLLYRLRDGSHTSTEAIAWLEQRLEARGSDAEEVMVSEHNRLAAGNVTIGNIIRSLRKIDDVDWSAWFEEMSEVDKVLRETGDFANLDFASRDYYRKTIEVLAQRSHKSEIDVARVVLSLAGSGPEQQANDIGFYLVGHKRPVLEAEIGYRPTVREIAERAYKRLDWTGIAGPIALFSFMFLVLAGWFLVNAVTSVTALVVLIVLFALPASEAASGLFNTLASLLMLPSRLVGYSYKKGVPEQARTLVVIPCLIGSKDTVDELLRNLEVHYLATTRGEVYFALLSDWTDSAAEESAGDRAILNYARAETAKLNARHAEDDANRFFFFHRRRIFNPGEGVWMGWERKRGKLQELNQLLRGDPDTTFMPCDQKLPGPVRYVMTLDADTRMTRDAVTKLAGKMSHPTNRPFVDPQRRIVTAGHGVLQPRVTPSLTTGEEASAFQRIYSVNRGLDPYVFTVSDAYQDLMGEGSFTGKGLYDIDAFEAVMQGRIGENAVLSHDLLEGSFARCGLATDVELVEDFPVRYDVEMSRQHRWARGDWQLLPYVFNFDYCARIVGRWIMIYILRRSLTPLAWLAASVFGWCVMSAGAALLWQAVLIFSLFLAPTLSLVQGALPRRPDIVARAHIHSVFSEINAANAQVALRIVFIAHTAYVMADAIVRTVYRLSVSRRKLLEWRTAAQAHSAGHSGVGACFVAMWQGPAIAVVALALAAFSGNGGFFVALPFSVLWLLSPAVAWAVSQSAETEDRLRLSAKSAGRLRQFARRTWRFFETFADEDNNHLPPDNFQEDPAPLIAHRTSPTNIGVYLLSTVSARDFGWIGLGEAVERLENTVATMERMATFRGHLFNWYDTRTLEPLQPRYVSSVDSGNLAGHLVAVSSACAQWAEAPSAHLDAGIEGIADTAAILTETLASLADDRKTVRPLRRRLEERVSGFHNAVDTLRREPEFASIRALNLTVLAREISGLAANLHHELQSPDSGELVEWSNALFRNCEAHVGDSMVDPDAIDTLRGRLLALRKRTRELAFAMNFTFLLREDRRLLSVGYRVDEGELDESCYDLLASEARLTSLFGIAKGDLPTEHWFRLGRPVVPVGSRAALVSWSGSMFEYLMPPLVMQERQGGILNQSGVLAIRRQMAYARGLKTPWGISESAFNARDHDLNYQYSNFGVPALGLKRGLGQNAVIAPYASLLASQYAPEEALTNLDRLIRLGALGRYGFHDAVDFTPTRVPEGATCAVVRNYMAHHQGMSIAAVANVVFHGRLRERFHSDPVIEAAELLLQEKAPREIPILSAKREPEETVPAEREQLQQPEIRTFDNPLSRDRATVLLSNGHYSLMATATGTGYSRWNGQSVTRWAPDPSDDRAGSFIFLRDTQTNEWWSATAEPKRAHGEKTRVVFSDDKAEFHKTVASLRSVVECIVAAENDGEGRRVTLFNNGDTDRFIEVTSYSELVIGYDDADAAHPAFSKMFVRTEIGAGNDVIHAWRRKRSATDPDMHVVHLVVGGSGFGRETQAETDRRAFLGRGRLISNAAAFDADARLSGCDGFTLDPVFALRRVVRIPAGKKASLMFWTLAAPGRAEAETAVGRYRYPESFQHEITHAWTRSQVQLRYVGITSQEAATFQMLGRYLLYPDLQMRPDGETVRNGLMPQSALWPLSISGDFPVFALRIDNETDLEIVEKALRAQEYLRGRGLLADLVIVNEKPSSYVQDMQNAIEAMCENARLRGQALGPRRHIFAVRRDLMDARTYHALIAAARVVLHTRNGKLSDQIARAAEVTVIEPPHAVEAGDGSLSENTADRGPDVSSASQGDRKTGDDLSFWNGYGGFAADGRSYVVRLAGGEATPQPWINVIANENFGFHVSAEGAGFTWSRNSRDFQLTPWSNDPVVNRPGEAFYIVDRDTGSVASPFAALCEDPVQTFEARHCLGHSAFSTRKDGLDIELVQSVDLVDAVKLTRMRLANTSARPKRLRIYGYAEWVLGNRRSRSAPFIVSAMDHETEVLSAKNRFSIDYAERVAFMACDRPLSSFTADRRAFFGNGGNVFNPRSVLNRASLSGSLAVDGDPCAAIATDVTVAPGANEEILFVLGDADSGESAASLVRKHRESNGDSQILDVTQHWDAFTQTLQVDTPDDAFDHMVNAWLPYQSLSCRLLARTAFYQASGAYGFRDQLQDTLAFVAHDPDLARRQILNAAARQFEKGDVQHWWLPESGAGVRTTIADDVVWLAYALSEYCGVTGDTAILHENLPFVTGPELEPGQHDSFFTPEPTEERATVYEHAARALDLAIERTGRNGLPLFLGGDWNDGMNRVGEGGEGESVWLGWFLLNALKRFSPFAKEFEDAERRTRWERHAETLKASLEETAWDGRYYRRGFYDDGTPLGSSASDECRIDSIAQSWSVLSGDYEAERANIAMDAVLEELADSDHQIVRLFTPPFDKTDREPGYIKAYPPGVRENGGQYTHAATWVVCALAALGRGDEAYSCFSKLNPVRHALDRQAADLYRVEPYVVAADIYSGDECAGRGGWTWYTGSAGWLYRAAVESILGISFRPERIVVNPCLPSHWPGFTASVFRDGKEYAIEVVRQDDDTAIVSVNGKRIENLEEGVALDAVAMDQAERRRRQMKVV